MISRALVDAAKQEFQIKSFVQIQTDTARTWAARACAAYELWKASTSVNRLDWYLVGMECEHEAVEHAALADDGSLLAEVRAAVAACKA